MAKTTREKLPETFTGSYSAIPHRVLDCDAFKGASSDAKALLFALIRQANGKNNGRLHLTDNWLKAQGWPSKRQNAQACKELIERGLIVRTRRGGLNAGCNWFAVTWLKISNFVGLDIAASNYHQGAWAECKLPPTVRRKPPAQKQKNYPHYEGSATLTTGVAGHSATLTMRADKPISDHSATLTMRDNVVNTKCMYTDSGTETAKRGKRGLIVSDM